MPRRIHFVIALSLLLAAAGPAWAQLTSSFSDAAEGWFVRDLNCSNYNTIVATHSLIWQGVAGDPDGHVTHHDVTNQCAFFVAPPTWSGDRSAYAGGSLEFSLTSTEFDWSGSDVVVLIGAGWVICHELPQLPPQPPVWGRYAVPLEAGVFRYNSSAGAIVSAAHFDAVLADLDILMLPAEFGSEIEETVGLDSVRLLPPASATPELPQAAVRLLGAQPNPFNPSTRIVFEVPEAVPVRLAVHDAGGRLIRVLRDGQIAAAGRHEATWLGRDDDGRPQPSGVYLVRLEAAGVVSSARVTLVR